MSISAGFPALPAVQDGAGDRPTLDNWLDAPGNVWAFRHARELFRSERVRTDVTRHLRQAPTPWRIDDDVADYLGRSHTDALVVLSDGQLSTEWYAPGVRRDDRHMLFSCTKSVVGLVAEVLVAKGVLDEHAPVALYVPEAEQGGYADARVRDLLDMTADISFSEDYEGPDVRAFRIACGQVEASDSPGIHAYTASLPGAGQHGRATRYASPTTDLAGWVCERATGDSLAELIGVHVWQQMGAEHEGDMLLDQFGGARASGGLCSSARDMARIGQLLVSDELDGPLKVAVDSLTRPGDREAWATGSLAAFIPGAAYRSYWYQLPEDPGTFLAAGIYGQRIYVDVPRRVVIAQQSSLPETFDPATWAETLSTFRNIARSSTRS